MSDNDKKNLQNLDFGDFFVILHWRWTVFPIASGNYSDFAVQNLRVMGL